MLTGKLALVTGAAGGIGRATCQVLAEAGAKIIAVDCNFTAAKETVSLLKDGDHMTGRVDVSDSKDVDAMFDNIKTKYYMPPNIVVNIAGILKDNFLLNTAEEDFQKVIDVNLKGTFLVTQRACKLLVDAGLPGSIINVSSIVAKRGNRGQCNYAASKAGVETFSKCVALEMARYNIRCNTILPGFIATSMTEGIPKKVKDMFMEMIPLKRLGSPEEVAEVIKFLASDQSSYVTGTSIQSAFSCYAIISRGYSTADGITAESALEYRRRKSELAHPTIRNITKFTHPPKWILKKNLCSR